MGRIIVLLLAVAAALKGAPRASGATPAEVRAAIEKGKKYLYSIQKEGNWEIVQARDPADTGGFSVNNKQFGGLTAIATYALLASGESYNEPHIKAAVEFLKRADMKGVYALGLRAQVWNSLPQDDSVRAAIKKDRDLLLAAVCDKGEALGFYGYGVDTPKDDGDKSASQFGVLGMWALAQAGADVPPAAWTLFDNAWHAQQLRDGGWCYNVKQKKNDNDDATYTMTAAGVATLFITQDYAKQGGKGLGNVVDPSIDKGVEWLGDHIRDLGDDRRYYALFGISRVGLAGGYKYLGPTDWFQFGADLIVHDQKDDGSWDSHRENPNNVPDTGFALLFLSRGRAPLIFSKLDYENVGPNHRKVAPSTWNQRPRDVANLTRMIGRQIESPLNWQVVSLHQGRKDLHDSPMIYMSGGTMPVLSAEDAASLKAFVEEGGIILGHADAAAGGFAGGFRKLGEDMFPGYRFAPLPGDHPIYTQQNFPRAGWKQKPPLEGMSNGARELMLLIPNGDPGKGWQAASFGPIKTDYQSQLMIDLALYAVDRDGLRERGQTYMVARRPDVKDDRTIKVARLKYNGNWDPEPGGWRRLATMLHNDRHVDLKVNPIDPAATDIDRQYGLAVLVVASDLNFDDVARDRIRKYVDAGGTLLVDVAGGRTPYRVAAESELAKLYPDFDKRSPVLPTTSAVYTTGGALGPGELGTIGYRRLARQILGNLHDPRLRGMDVAGRPAVLYSPEDLSVGLVGQPIGGVIGYDPASAAKVMSSVVFFAGR